MSYAIRVEKVTPQLVAVARGVSAIVDLPRTVPALIGVVWEFLKRSGVPTDGINVAIYMGHPVTVPVEAGARVLEPFTDTENVFCSATPAGEAATTAHIGPYDRLYDAHAAIHRWCRENAREPSGPNWEIYGHWTDDPASLRTDVFYLLR